MPSIIDDLIHAHDKNHATNCHNGNGSLKQEKPNGKLSHNAGRYESRFMPRGQRGRGRSPAKRLRDRERSILRGQFFHVSHEEFERRRGELQKLFGYVKLKNGEVISVDEARRRLSAALNENLRNDCVKAPICPVDIAEWHAPETFHDSINSLGEVDALGSYPALGIEPGTVLSDPKLRVPGGFRDPVMTKLLHPSSKDLKEKVEGQVRTQTLKGNESQEAG